MPPSEAIGWVVLLKEDRLKDIILKNYRPKVTNLFHTEAETLTCNLYILDIIPKNLVDLPVF